MLLYSFSLWFLWTDGMFGRKIGRFALFKSSMKGWRVPHLIVQNLSFKLYLLETGEYEKCLREFNDLVANPFIYMCILHQWWKQEVEQIYQVNLVS